MMLHQEVATAVMAAISERLGLVAMEMKQRSFGANDFLAFLIQIRQLITEPMFAIVLDNCTIHKTRTVKEYCE